MPVSRLVAELSSSIKMARKYALESNYDAAVTFYTGLDQELANYIPTVTNAMSKAKWERLRASLQSERSQVLEIQAEIKALVNPAEAVRRDRGDHSGGALGLGLGLGAGAGPSSAGHNPYNAREQRLAGGGGAGLGLGLGRAAPPPARVGDINEHLYGDPDRFGPPKDEHAGGLRRPAPRGVTPSAPARVAPRVTSGAVTPPTTGGGPSNGACVGAGVGKERHKAPLPKFNKGNAPNRGGAGGVKVTDKGGANAAALAGKPPFEPRPGEEELVNLIAADMSFGQTSVKWEDIAGQKEAKQLLEEAVVYPVLMPDYFLGIRRPWRGVLMYGPPGTGKTMLAKAVASQCNTTFFNISPATLTSKWRGDSEKLVRILFDMARHYAPSTIFIDEIDSLCTQRGGGDEHEASRRVKGTLLTQMDGVGVDSTKLVMVLGATNHPWDIDEAMRRRLEQRIYIPLPDRDDRVRLFEINTQNIKLSDDVDFVKLSSLLDKNYYSGADITNVCRDAAMMSMRRFMASGARELIKERGQEIGREIAAQPTTMQDFIEAIRKVPSSVNIEGIRRFEEWKKEFETNI